ncbi:MAG: hypothetical protein IKO06_05375 [Alphaproteobacteria bacterium]|nr:hypothetical protein [Alphaproteobacteria bacterium]
MKKFILLILTAIISFGYINESRAGFTYVYDEKGRLIRAPGCGGDFFFEYDDDGNLIKEGNETSFYYKYSYENGNKTKAEEYNCSSGTCTKSRESVYTYTDGNMTKEETYNNCSSGTCTKYTEHRYTYTDGNMTKEEYYYNCSSGGTCKKSSENVYTYTDGNMTKKEYYDNCSSGTCKKSSEHRYTYEDGNMTKDEYYYCWSGTCTKSSESVYTYEFDKYGNIIKKYHNGNLSESHEYPDEYYNMKCTKAGDCTSCSGGKVLQGKECVASCGASFRLNDGECDRIRYTPAEAAQYLKDTDNEIIMTFKVNR